MYIINEILKGLQISNWQKKFIAILISVIFATRGLSTRSLTKKEGNEVKK